MVCILGRGATIIASTAAMVFSVISLSQTGITKNMVLMPLTTSLETYLNVDFGLLLLSAFFAALSLSLIIVHSIKTDALDLSLVIPPAVASIFILIFAGTTQLSVFLALGLIAGTLLVSYIAFEDKEQYKKISAYKISTHASSKMFFILALIITGTIYMELDSAPKYAENTIDTLLKQTTGLTQENLTNIQEALIQQQKEASYQYIDSMGRIYVETLRTTGDLSPAEKTKCMDSFNNNMDEFESAAKGAIDQNLKGGGGPLGSDKTEMIFSIFELIKSTYPILVAFTVFATISTLSSMVLVPLVGLLSWILWRNARSPPKKEDLEEYDKNNSQPAMV